MPPFQRIVSFLPLLACVITKSQDPAYIPGPSTALARFVLFCLFEMGFLCAALTVLELDL